MKKLTKKALIIGNSEYKNISSLKNPENDSKDLSKLLKEIGFEITINNNLTRRNFDKLIKNFSKHLISDSADIVIFFYSGHAIQYQGENYLIPTDSLIETPRDICAETISLSYVIEEFNFTTSKLNLFIMDSCRDNPFEEKMFSYSEVRNIEHIKLEKGLGNRSIEQFSKKQKLQNPFLIAFPTGAGDVAYDFEFPDDRNGLYTKYLLQVLKERHSNLYQYFDRLAQLVSSANTPIIQNPVTYGAIKGCKYTFLEVAKDNNFPDEVHRSEIREEIMETNPLNIIEPNSDKYLWVDFTNKLMWEIKKPDNIDNKFTYEDAESEVSHLNEVSFLHFDNWRIPTLQELQTLLSVEINGDYHVIRPFSKNTKLAYWTTTDSEEIMKQQDYKKILNFKSEKHSDYKKYHKAFLRYVRTITNFELPKYLQVGNKEQIKFSRNILLWIDKENQIMWEVKTERNYQDKYTYSQALRHIKKLNDTKYLGYKDWKLPNNHELNILIQNKKVILNILPELPCYWSAYVKNDHNGIPMYHFTCLKDGYKNYSKDLNIKYHLMAIRSCKEKVCK